MNRSRTTLGLALCLAITPVLAAGSNCRTTYWTPETIGFKEQLPNTSTPPGVGCMLTEFSVNDRNWMDKIRLPHAFGPLDIINNAASSEKTLEIHDSISGVPGKPLKLAAGRAISFLSRKSGQSVYTWDSSSQSPPNTSRWQIPRNSQLISIIDLRNGKHAGELILPSVGKAFDTITIENNATSATKVLGTHTPFPGQRMDVASGEAVRAEFDPFARRWMWVHAPYREKKVKDRYHRVASRTVMELQDGEWASPVTPPSVAHDRDRIILRSSATWDSEIKVNKGDPASKHLPLRRGDEYEFVFVAEQNRWHLLRQSIRPVDTTNQKEVRLKDEGYDVIEVNAPVSAPITPNVILPKPRQGLRVIAVGHPVMTMNIIADNLNVPVLQTRRSHSA